MIIINVGKLGLEKDAPLFNRKEISGLQGKIESVSFRESLYGIRNQLVGIIAFVIRVVNKIFSSLSFDFE